MTDLQAPFPWFGGKRRVAAEVWSRLGDTPNYVEPFAGSLATLLGRPVKHVGKIETINDLDGYLANFWRSVSLDPEATARYADWPVNENDLTARHVWLTSQRDGFQKRLEGDPEFYDPRVAGWWVAGVCGWIGSGYCAGGGPWQSVDGLLTNIKSNAGQGVNRKLPHLGDAGQGVNRQLPHLGDAGQGGIYEWFNMLASRLRNVRVTSGDWTRVVTESVTTRHGVTGLFLDPPYGSEVEQTRVYASDSGSVAADVRQWCIENGNDRLMRIALCGYAGEGHEQLLDHGWESHAWKTSGGYGGGRGGTGDENRAKERIFYSPHCLGAVDEGLF